MSDADTALPCAHAGRCGGCPWFDRAPGDQAIAKRDTLVALLGARATSVPVDFTTPATTAFRTRLDLRLSNGKLGLLALDGSGEVIPMERCAIATPEVHTALAALAADPPPIARASVRLRARAGRVGLWLDLPHVALKTLLDEGTWLARQVARGVVIELGPKGRGYTDRLTEPGLNPWSSTRAAGHDVDLLTTVMGFTQPGDVPNGALVEATMAALGELDADSALELGAGAGNLTLPLAASGLDVLALELDTAPLTATLAAARTVLGLATERVVPHAASFHREADVPALVAATHRKGPVDLLVCDPPRSGLGSFINGLAALSRRLRPRHIVYVSCHPEALARDVEGLAPLGYALRSLRGVDQFPWTPHCEWVARLERA